MFTFKSKPQSLVEIYKSGFALYAQSLKSVWHWSLILGLMSAIPTLIFAYLVHSKVSYSGLLSFNLLYLLLLPVSAFMVGMIIYQIFLLGTDTNKSQKDIMNIVLNKLPILVGAYVIIGFLTWLGLMLFFLPGIFIAITLIFVAPLILLDDHSFIDAFKNTWLLVWHNWWRTFTVLLIPMILFLVILPSVYTKVPSLGYIIFDIVRTTLVTPLFFSLVLTLFYDLKSRHHVALHLPRRRKEVKVKTVEG
jgi:hypothetical protein